MFSCYFCPNFPFLPCLASPGSSDWKENIRKSSPSKGGHCTPWLISWKCFFWSNLGQMHKEYLIWPKDKSLRYEFVTCFCPNFSCLSYKSEAGLKFGGKIFQSKTAEKSETLTLPSFGSWWLGGQSGKSWASNGARAGNSEIGNCNFSPIFSPQMDLGHDFLFPRPLL